MSLLILAFLVVLVAAATQGAIGFGFAMVAVPTMTLAVDPRTAVVGIGIAGLAMTVTVAVRERDHARWRTAGLLLAAAVVGMPVGLLVLRAAPERVLTAMIGAAVLGCAVLIWRGLRISTSHATAVGVGVLAGVLSTSTGTNGPPLVAAFQAMRYEPRVFRATLAAVFTGSGILSMLGFVVAGQMSGTALQIGLVGVPAVLLGWWIGNAVFHRISGQNGAARFRAIVLGALAAGGTVLVTRALLG